MHDLSVHPTQVPPTSAASHASDEEDDWVFIGKDGL